MFRRALLLTILAVALLAGCSDDSGDPVVVDPPVDPDFATLVYRLDDSLNQSYSAADALALAGPFTWDAATGIITPSAGSTGPFPALYDDGPAAGGGHEPDGETAGDNIWTVAVRVETPAAAWTFDYWPIAGVDGAILWPGAGGTATVTAGETGTVTLPGVDFVPLATAAMVVFSIDDTANASYSEADGLAWKGSFSYDAARRVLTPDASWGGPYPLLYDDGPWTDGGHEPAGATAGDHLWSVAVWVDNSSEVVLEYGAIRGSVGGSDGQWIWSGANGTVTVAVGQPGPVQAPGLTLPAWGTIDLMVTIDLSCGGCNLAAGWQSDWTADAAIRGNFTGWSTVALHAEPANGTDSYAFQLALSAGPHDGLLKTGDVLEWVMVLGGNEYRVGGAASNQMVDVRFSGDGSWRGGFDVLVQPDGGRNLTITVP